MQIAIYCCTLPENVPLFEHNWSCDELRKTFKNHIGVIK